jgi:transposase
VQKSIDVELALSGHYDHRLRDVELSVLKTAKRHDVNTLSLLCAVPGIGEILRLVRLYESHHLERCPRVQDFVSYCRLGMCAKGSAGKRDGTAGTKSGNAYRTWAFSEAAGRFLRNNPAGHNSLARFENKHGRGKALPVLAHQPARAVDSMLKRGVACDRNALLRS